MFSPHLDDAVLSAGCALLARPGSVVVTVLAGMPADQALVTAWDTKCGFRCAGDAMRVRWLEDARAMQLLDASLVHLAHLDGQYGVADFGACVDDIADLAAHYSGLAPVSLMGVGHADHSLVAEAFVSAMLRVGRQEFWMAADMPYRGLSDWSTVPGLRWVHRGLLLENDDAGPFDPDVKRAARDCYRSQLGALGDVPLDMPEVFWKVTVSPG